MAANDLRLIQENGTSDFVERILSAVSAGKALLINGSNIPELRVIEIADINGLVAQLAAKISSTEKGAINGVATLGVDGKVPSTQLPEGMLGSVTYQGIWNASTNTPTIPAASSSNKGHYYVVNVAGSTSIDGITDWKIGDWIISNGTAWEKVDTTDMVTSVNGQIGAVVLGIAEITGLQSALDLKANLASPTFTGTVTLPTTTSIGNVSSTELGYLDGVTSAIQTQINAKQAAITGAATTILSANLTVSRALVSDASGKVAVSTVTSTELGYLSGVTSAIQTQLATKANLASPTFTGTVTLPTTTSIGNVTSTELGYLDGVTSAIQTQLDSKLKWVTPPATPTSTGTAGEASYENDYLYICVATNSWKRMPLAIWS